MHPAVLWIILLLLLKFVHEHETLKAESTPVSKRSQQDFCPFARRDPQTNCFIIDTVACTVHRHEYDEFL